MSIITWLSSKHAIFILSLSLFQLRDSCRCPLCVHPLMQGRKVDCTHFSPKIQPHSWALRDSGHLEIIWPHDETAKLISIPKGIYAKDRVKPHVSTFSSEWYVIYRLFFFSLKLDCSKMIYLNRNNL